MPKSRSSNSVASSGTESGINGGAGGGAGVGMEASAGSLEELANRLADRLAAAGPIMVTVDSMQRGREDCQVTFNTDGTASVVSGSGNTYAVDPINGTCTCPDHRYRSSHCRHLRATETAMGQIAPDGSPETAGNAQIELNNAISDQIRNDQVEEELRRENSNGNEDDGFFYSDEANQQQFMETLQRARNEQIVYEYNNVLNGSNITFGLEIEFVDGNADAIARDLYNLGLCAYSNRANYHSRSQPSVEGKWKVEYDASVCSGSRGGEIVSPVLTDTPETWENLKTICEVAKRHGARIDTRCGGHVHVGMDPLDTARQRWKRFFRTTGAFEPEIVRFSGGTEGRIRSGARTYAHSFTNVADTGLSSRNRLETQQDVNELARTLQPRHNDRYHGINLTNIHDWSRPNTVEFRYFNSSLDHRQLQANVKLANGIIMASQKARIRNNDGNDIMKRRGQMLREVEIGQSFNRSNHEGIKKFVDICFTRKKDKDDILKVYAKNDWASI